MNSKTFIVFCLTTLALFFLWPTTVTEGQISPESKPVVNNTLKKIAWCESENKQFNPDGTLHRGEINHMDVGKFQVNEKYHLVASERLGLNIYTLGGNTAYAIWLYDKEGSTPWNWSKHCWDDPNAIWHSENGDMFKDK